MALNRDEHLLRRQLAVADRNRVILEDYVLKKRTGYAIARDLGISREAVRLVLHAHAVDTQGAIERNRVAAREERRRQHEALARERRKKKAARTRERSAVYHEVANLYRAGATFEDLYAQGYSQWVVDRALEYTGTAPRPRGIPRKGSLRETVKDLYRRGASRQSLRLLYSAYIVKHAAQEVDAEPA